MDKVGIYKKRLLQYIKDNNLNVYDVCVIDGNGTNYIRINPSSLACNNYSVSKTFTATAVGYAVNEGKLSLESTIAQYFKEYLVGDYDKKWHNVTVKDLLVHTIGQRKGTLFEEEVCAADYTDLTKHIFEEKLEYPAGKRFAYSNVGGYLLAQIIEKVSGESYAEFLRKRLFYPLDFRHFAVTTCRMGHPMGATGIIMRTYDLAKYGYMYACGGHFEGNRIVDENWVKLANTIAVKNPNDLNYTYGCFWKIGEGSDFFGDGRNGQMVYIAPEERFAIAVHSYLEEKNTVDLVKVMTE